MGDVGHEINQVPILPVSERTITGARLQSPIIYDQYRRICTEGARGRRVLVVGSGRNTEAWRALGYTTLDIDPKTKSDIRADANRLEKVVSPDSLNIVVSECLTLDPKGENGVSLDLYLPQVYRSLSKGGQLFFITSASVNIPDRAVNTLTPDLFLALLKKYGFVNVAAWNGPLLWIGPKPKSLGTKAVVDSLYMQSAKIYHGQKI